MNPMKIALLREEKVPHDRRVPLSPAQGAELTHRFVGVEVVVQPSPYRCFSDDEYRGFHIPVAEDVSDADLLMGIKEVPPQFLIPGKDYVFFTHTFKKQPYNRPLLQKALQENVRLVDYELMVDDKGARVIGFGKWAGIVGTHYAMMMVGRRTGAYSLPQARNCHHAAELFSLYKNMGLPPARIVTTGGGRVAQGIQELLEVAQVKRVSPEELEKSEYTEPVFAVLHSEHLYERADGGFDKQEFYSSPEKYRSRFRPWLRKAHVLINGMYWSIKASRLFEVEDIDESVSLHTIADITCDIGGSVPITLRNTTSDSPFYGYHATEHREVEPFQPPAIDMMTISNLPNELPRDAAQTFGQALLDDVLPLYLKDRGHPVWERATIAQNGKLTDRFGYLQAFAEGKE